MYTEKTDTEKVIADFGDQNILFSVNVDFLDDEVAFCIHAKIDDWRTLEELTEIKKVVDKAIRLYKARVK